MKATSTLLPWKNLLMMICLKRGVSNINKITLKDCTECHKDLERFCSQMVFQLLLSSVFFKETESENRMDFLVYTGADSGEFQTGLIFKDKVLPSTKFVNECVCSCI